jgi:hypothetical protein
MKRLPVLVRLSAVVALLVTLAALSSVTLRAQTTYGSIVGTVTDNSGAALPGATVIVTCLGTSEAQKVKSDASGNYRIVNLLPAIYKVEVEKSGFKRSVLERLDVAVGATVRRDAVLEVGVVTETVEVTTQAPLLQTDSGSLSTEVQGATVQEMPLNGRNVMNLLALASGVIPQGSTSGGTGTQPGGHTSPGGWGNYAIGGSLAGESAIYVDGASINVLGGSGNQVGLVVTQDAVQEFNVTSNGQSADFGRNGGGVVVMASKSGTNSFHGSVYEYFRNAALNSNDFFNKQAQLAAGEPNKPLKFNQNQYGASFGGPIKKDKAFFMFTWEGFQADNSSATPGFVPTKEMQSGIIPAVNGTEIADLGASSYYTYDQNGKVTGGPFQGAGFSTCQFDRSVPGQVTITNLWSAGCGDPLAKVIRGYYPQPPASAINPNTGNDYYAALPQGNKQNQYNARVDYNLSNKQRLFGRYTYWNLKDTPVSRVGNYNGWQTADSYSVNDTHQAVLGDTIAFTPNTILDVRVNYLREYYPTGIPASLGTDFQKDGFSGTYLTAIASQMTVHQLPNYSFGGANGNIGSLMNGPFSEDWFNNYGVATNLIHMQGKHSLKFGMEARLMQDTNVGGGNSGQFAFGNSAYTGDDWADFLLGYLNQSGMGHNATGGSLQLAIPTTGYNYYQGYYVTDTWETTRRLTLTLGVRWELPGGIYEKHDENSVLLPSYQWQSPTAGKTISGILGLVNSPVYGSRSSINVKNNLFAPHVGFAYRLGNDTAVRGGYGLSYLPIDSVTGAMPTNSPFLTMSTPCGSTGSLPDSKLLMYNCFENTALRKPTGRSLTSQQLTDQSYVNQPSVSIEGPVPNQKYPYVQQWNLSVSRQMKGDFMVELGYAGTKGTHMPSLGNGGGNNPWELNQLSDNYDSMGSALLASGTCGSDMNGTPLTVGQCLRPYPQYGWVADTLAYNANTIYHSMELKAEKRFKSGGELSGNYVWSKIIGDTDSNTGGLEVHYNPSGQWGAPHAGVMIQDYDNMKAERSVLTYDVPQRAVISYVLDLPFGKDQRWGSKATGLIGHTISGWGINGITTFQKGFHLGFSDNGNSTNTDLFTTFGAGQLRPNFVTGCNRMQGVTGSYASRVIAGAPQFNGSYNQATGVSTGCWQAPDDFQFGSEPRVSTTLFAQGINNFDFSAMKTTNITERMNMQFRAEFFNIFNRVQFAPPNTVNEYQGFGTISTDANQPRLVQLSLRVTF